MSSAFDSPTRKSLAAAISCISIVGIGLSLVIPLLALRMEAAGFPARTNGLHIAVAGLATLIGAPLTPLLVRSFGMRPLLYVSLLLSVASLLAFAFCEDYRLWLAIRIAFVLGLSMIFVISEYWISAVAPRGHRGMVLGLYATVLALGFAIGPALLGLTGPQGPLPLLIAAGLVAAAAVPAALAGAAAMPTMEGSARPDFRRIVQTAPIALAASLLYGAIETGLNGLLPVFGLRAGFSPEWASFQLSLFALGNVVFPIPLGLIADRVDKTRMLGLFAGFGLVGALFLPGLAPNRPAYALALFVWGGLIGGLYPVGLAILAEKFHGARLGGANAAYIMVYALGMMAGPPALGVGLDLSASHGLFDTLALAFALYLGLIVVLARPKRGKSTGRAA